jgi:hypothetical protein
MPRAARSRAFYFDSEHLGNIRSVQRLCACQVAVRGEQDVGLHRRPSNRKRPFGADAGMDLIWKIRQTGQECCCIFKYEKTMLGQNHVIDAYQTFHEIVEECEPERLLPQRIETVDEVAVWVREHVLWEETADDDEYQVGEVSNREDASERSERPEELPSEKSVKQGERADTALEQ